MLKQDVTIHVEINEVGTYNDEDNHLSSVNGIISCASEDDKNVSCDVTQDLGLYFLEISSSSYLTSIN